MKTIPLTHFIKSSLNVLSLRSAKNGIVLIVCTFFLLMPTCLSAQKVATLTSDVVLRSTPQERGKAVARVAADGYVVLLEPVREDYWVKVQSPDGSIGYIDSAALSIVREATPEEASTLVVEQDVVPRDGAYEMTSSNTKVHMGEPYSDDVREDIYAQGDVVPNARYVNSDWMLITEGTDSMYVERKYMRKLRLYELVRRYGEDSPIVAAERECIERAPGLTVFNDGLKAGLYGSWLIVAMAVVMAVSTYIVFVHKDKVKVRDLHLFGGGLVLLSVLEVWYFLSLGVDDAAWFLGKTAGDYGWVNFFIMLAVTAVQGLGVYRYAVEVQTKRGFSFSQRWMFLGVILSAALYGIWCLMNMNTEIPNSTKAPVLVVCAMLGQIPQALAMLIGFWWHRRTRLPGGPSIFAATFTYWAALTGLVCIGSIAVGLLVAMAVAAILVFALVRNFPSMAYQAVQDTLKGDPRHDAYVVANNRLKDMVRSGSISPQKAKDIKTQLDQEMSKKDGDPDKVSF